MNDIKTEKWKKFSFSLFKNELALSAFLFSGTNIFDSATGRRKISPGFESRLSNVRSLPVYQCNPSENPQIHIY